MQVSKWGNSLAVRLPKSVVESLSLQAGDEITVLADNDGQLIVGADAARKRAIQNLAARKWVLPDDWHFDRDEANAR